MTIYRYGREKITGYALHFWQKEVQEELKQEYEDGNRCEDIYKITCWKCGEEFYCKNRIARYCSYRCVNDAQIARRKERKRLERQKVCRVCNKAFQAKRKDSLYCSPACKQKYYRNVLQVKV